MVVCREFAGMLGMMMYLYRALSVIKEKGLFPEYPKGYKHKKIKVKKEGDLLLKISKVMMMMPEI